MHKDKVYARPIKQIEAFRFDAKVADVFENMINRSVPGYALVLDLIGVITERYALENTNCYDLGCSLGASTLKIRQHLPQSCHLIGVDNSNAMVERCRANMTRDHSRATYEILAQKLQDTPIKNASIVVINFTLQFIPNNERLEVIESIARGMVEGGALILSEKIGFDDQAEHDAMTELHHAFKKSQGYSDLEVAQKRAALENVLMTNTQREHIERLQAAGFKRVQLFVRTFNFASFLAIR